MRLSEDDHKAQEPATAPAFATSADGEQAMCTTCSTGRLAHQKVNIAIWQGERLVVVDNVPALVCQNCGEQYYEDGVAMALDLLRGSGFPEEAAVREITVPVFEFGTSQPKTT